MHKLRPKSGKRYRTFLFFGPNQLKRENPKEFLEFDLKKVLILHTKIKLFFPISGRKRGGVVRPALVIWMYINMLSIIGSLKIHDVIYICL